MAAFEVNFEDWHQIPGNVLDLVRRAELKVDPEDLLPLLSGVVHDAGEYLHGAGGTDGRFDCDCDENPARMQKEASRALAAVEAMVELNAFVAAEDARSTEARRKRMGEV